MPRLTTKLTFIASFPIIQCTRCYKLCHFLYSIAEYQWHMPASLQLNYNQELLFPTLFQNCWFLHCPNLVDSYLVCTKVKNNKFLHFTNVLITYTLQDCWVPKALQLYGVTPLKYSEFLHFTSSYTLKVLSSTIHYTDFSVFYKLPTTRQ